ncbi:MAG: S-layer homology domain-containing protein [Clostridia bacterium]|nr:S-layer homology domain-containing protein [Clostridia bacterium]
MKIKLLILTAALLITAQTAAFADVLGDQTGGWSTYMGADTYFHNVQFTSPSVGKQNEYYVEYTPNSEAVPVVVNGASIWGTRTIKQAESYMEDNGFRPLAGINADYFSFKTGIPMGHTIIDGEIVSKDFYGQDAVGFREDGTGMIGWLDIKTSVSDGDSKVEIQYINKWCQPGFDPIYLMTDKFGNSTKTSSECLFLICDPIEGRLHVDETMTVTVEDMFVYNGAIDIPDGKIVLLMDTSGDRECYDFLSNCYVGEELTIANESIDDDGLWSEAENALSSVGGRLVENGVARTDFEAGAAPRTAVGIKDNGNIIFYVLDGRQQGYSYGAQLRTLAQRMAELGCVEAINLDGGGSTVISAHFPGEDEPKIMNKPSDGYVRSVANYLFLRDNRENTNEPWIVTLRDAGNTNYLSGMSSKIEIESMYDTGNFKMEEPYNIDFRAETDTGSYIDEDGYIIFNGSGIVEIIMSGEYGDVASAIYTTYESPDEIKIFNQADWKEINEITAAPSDELQLALSAASYVNGIEIHSNDHLYSWEVQGDIGTITRDGIFTLADVNDAEGNIIVTAGDTVKKIPVHISDNQTAFADTETHWARAIIDEMADTGIITGMEEDGRFVFKPDNNITRAEFASMIVRYQGLDLNGYDDKKPAFTDADKIPQWAQNAVRAAYSEGYIMGRSNDNGKTFEFAPYDNITRAEAMTILGRILPSDMPYLDDISFADSSDIPQWAAEGIKKLLTVGVVNGYEDNTIHPNNNMSRAEAAAMLYKLSK